MRILVLSDVHYACDAEQARRGHEARAVGNPAFAAAVFVWRHFIWLRDPLAHNHRLAQILKANPSPDLVVANGDFTVDSAFVGISDDAALTSARHVVGELRRQFGTRLKTTIGDHDLGKKSLFGGVGGPRFLSWERCRSVLEFEPVWQKEAGAYSLIGVPSTVVALPVFLPEIPNEEHHRWVTAHNECMDDIARAFASVQPGRRIILFVHDPTALPFLLRIPEVATRLECIETTVIGHLHSRLVLRTAQALSGIPHVKGIGHTIHRYTAALREARCWKQFNVLLCPSPPGLQCLKDGGYLHLNLDESGRTPLSTQFIRLPW
jgi:Calcineurin-like phosphoesterase